MMGWRDSPLSTVTAMLALSESGDLVLVRGALAMLFFGTDNDI